jgi:uncharacterized protein YdaU (DUF1376 family)
VGRLKWYKRDPNKALVGMRRLTLEECGAYNLILDLIYAHDGQLADDDQFLTGWIGGDIRIWRRMKARLVELHKIEVKDGFITNPRATEEVAEGLARVDKASRAGAASAKIRRTSGVSSADVALHSNASYSPKSQSFINKNNTLIPTQNELALQLSTTTTTKDSCRKPASRFAYPDDFEGFWKGYPTDSNMSKAEAFKAWQKLDESEKATCVATLSDYRLYCRSKPDYRVLHAVRYITQKRFDGFKEQSDRNAKVLAERGPTIFVRHESPQWDAWNRYLKATSGRGAVYSSRTNGWEFPSEWPPEIPSHQAE